MPHPRVTITETFPDTRCSAPSQGVLPLPHIHSQAISAQHKDRVEPKKHHGELTKQFWG